MTSKNGAAAPKAGTWPILPVSSGENILAEQYNTLLSGAQLWPGNVNGGGFALTNAILPPASSSYVGGVKPGPGVFIAPDGTIFGNVGSIRTISADNAQMTATDYNVLLVSPVATITLPVSPLDGLMVAVANTTGADVTVRAQAGATVAGGANIVLTNGTRILLQFAQATLQWYPLNEAFQQPGSTKYNGILQPGTTTVVGGVKQGSNVTIAADGTISAATTGVIAGTIRSVAVNTTLTPTDYIVIATAAGITITLPTAPTTGQTYYVKNGATGLITVLSGSNLDGAASMALNITACILAVYDGTMYRIL